ncbi:hypothetical protein [Cereibacter sphaeroides]|uniref:hypothetical protein n=1 Tax=Cereibacter sphaeroides TaxID=1063 RepID=UPI003AEF4C7F
MREPEVDCILKGKARVRYEFGCKVSIATTLKGGFVVGTRLLPGNLNRAGFAGNCIQVG